MPILLFCGDEFKTILANQQTIIQKLGDLYTLMSTTNTIASQIQAADTQLAAGIQQLATDLTAVVAAEQKTIADFKEWLSSQASQGTLPASVVTDLQGFVTALGTSHTQLATLTSTLTSADPGAAPTAPAVNTGTTTGGTTGTTNP